MKTAKIIVIVGPTASGKTALSITLTKRLNGEVISADSRQVYRGLNLGTGKVTKKEMAGIPHHLLDVASPKRVFTAHDYVRHATKALRDIISRGKTPIICGGTGFYIDALLGRITLPDVKPDVKLRRELAKLSAEELYTRLRKIDPRRARSIDKHNPVRLVRAIEIALSIGATPKPARTKSSRLSDGTKLDVQWIGIRPSIEVLRQKIHDRLLSRMRSGMLAEARRLHSEGLSYARMEALGLEYRYLARYLRGTLTKERMLSELETEIWKYAKRQMTYWRRNRDIEWKHLTY